MGFLKKILGNKSGNNRNSAPMRVVTTTDTWSIECGDDEHYFKGEEYKLRLVFEAASLEVEEDPEKEPSIIRLSNTISLMTGRVIFKDEYLLIVESIIRFGIVLNNEFRFGNHNYVGNKDIDHSAVQVGDVVQAMGYFRFQTLFFSIFTFLPDELGLPPIDHMWKVVNTYKIQDEGWESEDLATMESVEEIDTRSQTIHDAYAIEFELIDATPLPFDDSSGTHGFFDTICWIDEKIWVKNCEGRINHGIKRGKWVYLDKKGENRREFQNSEN